MILMWTMKNSPEQISNLYYEDPHCGPTRIRDALFAVHFHNEIGKSAEVLEGFSDKGRMERNVRL